MKRLFTIPILFTVLLLTGCPAEKDARDAIAAAHGYIVSAQSQWEATCKLNNTQVKCVTTNRLIAAQHTAADALTVYCGGVPPTGTPTYLDGGTCVPQKSALNALSSAVSQMNVLVTDIKSLLGAN